MLRRVAGALGRLPDDLLPGGRGRSGRSSPGRRPRRGDALHRALSLSPPPQDDLPRARPASLLVQQPLRQLPQVQRLRRDAGVRSDPGGPQRGPVAGGGRRGSLGTAPLLPGAQRASSLRRPGRRLAHRPVADAGPALPGRRALRNGVLPGGDGLPRLEGTQALPRVHPGLPPPLPASEPLSGVRRDAAQAAGQAGARRRSGDRFGVGDAPGRPSRVARRAGAAAHGGPGGRHDPPGAVGPRRLPAGRGAGLPLAEPADADRFRRRGAAHRPGQLLGLDPGGHPLRAGRALHRAPPPGRGRADESADAPPGRRQHGGRGRTSRRGGGSGRPRGGAGPGRWRGRRGSGLPRPARGSSLRRDQRRTFPLGPVPRRSAAPSQADRPASPPPRGRRPPQPSRRGRRVPRRRDDRGDGGVGLGEVHPCPRRALPSPGTDAGRGRDDGQGAHGRSRGRLPVPHRPRTPGRGGSGGPEPDRTHSPLESRDLREGVGRSAPPLCRPARRRLRRARSRRLLLQRGGRTLRGVQGRRPRGGGDGLHGRCARSVRAVRGEAVPSRSAGREGARHGRERGAGAHRG